MTNNPEDLQSALKWVFVEVACEEDAPPPPNPPEEPPSASSCTNYQLTAQERAARKRVRIKVQNNDGEAVNAVRLHLESWPNEWGALEKFKVFDNNEIHVNGYAPVDVQLTNNPALPAGQNREISLMFRHNISDDLSGIDGYVEFANGCRVIFGSGGQSAPPTPPAGGCPNPRTNQYNVENTTNNPFYGIKFEYQSGTEIKNGNYDEFTYVLNAADAAAMTTMQLEAKAGSRVSTVTLDSCSFTQAEACPMVQAQNGHFNFQFLGASDNGDGTLTLRFKVQVLTNRALSHATFGLPGGIAPSSPTNIYQSQVCP